MRILVHEHEAGGGLAGLPLPASLRRERSAMLPSIVTDLARVNVVLSVAVTLDPCWESRLAETDDGALAPCQLADGSLALVPLALDLHHVVRSWPRILASRCTHRVNASLFSGT